MPVLDFRGFLDEFGLYSYTIIWVNITQISETGFSVFQQYPKCEIFKI
jgi:hypothetical protein